VPIIGIQAELLRIENRQVLNFTKIIDSYEEPELETDSNEEIINEEVFKKKWPHVYSVWSHLREEIESFTTINRIGYRKRSISLSYGDKNRIWIENRAQGQVCIKIRPVNTDGFVRFLDESGVSYSEGSNAIRIRINPKKIAMQNESLKKILSKVYEEKKERVSEGTT
jgi:hypothetical protein